MFSRIIWLAALTVSLRRPIHYPQQSGLISYADEAYLDNRLVENLPDHFVWVNEDAVLRTGADRAEVLFGAVRRHVDRFLSA